MLSVAGEPRGRVLAIEGATLTRSGDAPRALMNVQLELARGDLALVLAGPASPGWLLADACCGLATAKTGRVRFLDEDWSAMAPISACAMRGRIGRVFGGENWLNYASVGDNMMVRALHHTRRTETDIRAEAERLSRDFGLPGLPTSRAHEMLVQDLRRAACARAFFGAPELIILEHPTRDAYPGIMGALMNAVKRARERGAAILWVTTADEVWGDTFVRASTRARLVGSQFVATEN